MTGVQTCALPISHGLEHGSDVVVGLVFLVAQLGVGVDLRRRMSKEVHERDITVSGCYLLINVPELILPVLNGILDLLAHRGMDVLFLRHSGEGQISVNFTLNFCKGKYRRGLQPWGSVLLDIPSVNAYM